MPEKQNSAAEIEILKALYAAINQNDIAAAILLFDANAERIEPTGFPSAGTYRGHAEIGAHLAKGRETWAEGRCHPEQFASGSGKLIALLHVRVRLKNQTDWVEGRFADGFIFNDGKIMQMRTVAKRKQALDWAGIQDASYF